MRERRADGRRTHRDVIGIARRKHDNALLVHLRSALLVAVIITAWSASIPLHGGVYLLSKEGSLQDTPIGDRMSYRFIANRLRATHVHTVIGKR